MLLNSILVNEKQYYYKNYKSQVGIFEFSVPWSLQLVSTIPYAIHPFIFWEL